MRLLHVVYFPLVFALLSLPSYAQRPGGGRPGGGGFGGPRNATTPGRGTHGPDLPGYYTGKHAEDEDRVEFRSDTILVQVPVVVTDKSGQHIHGLKKEDFRVTENSKEQAVTSFEEITATHNPVAIAQAKPGQFTNLVLDASQPRSITVIVLDTVNTAFLDQAYARKELIKFLAKNIDKGQTLALVLITAKGLKVVSGLTASPENLQQALKKASGELSALENVSTDAEVDAFTGDTTNLFSPSTATSTSAALGDFVSQGDVDYAQFKQDQAIESTMNGFLGVAWSLSGIPGRKTLLWVTGGFPFTIDSPSAVPGGRLSLLYERAMQALNDSEVSIYPVDAQGLVNYGSGANVRQAPSGAAGLQQLSSRAWLMNSKHDTLRDFAEMTGGRAFYNTNDLAGAFQRATDDASSYYMLGYYLDIKNTNPGWRELKVKIADGKGMEVRSRKGFFVTNATMNPEATRVNDMNFALAAPFEATSIPLLMEWGAVTSALASKNNKKQVAFTLHIAGSAVTVEGTHGAISLAIAAMATRPGNKKEGNVVADNVGEDVKASLKPENVASFRSHGMAYNNKLELAPGQYSVRFVVRDNLSGRLGSVSAPVIVN